MGEIKDANVKAISLVKAGANEEPIQIYKSADLAATTPETPPVVTAEAPIIPVAVASKTLEVNQPVVEKSTEEVAKSEDVQENKIMAAIRKVLASVFGAPAPVVVNKAQDIDNSVEWTSFASRMTDPEIKAYRAIDILYSVLSEIFWRDDIENGKELIETAMAEFTSYIKGVLNSPREIQKAKFEKGDDVTMLTKEALTSLLKEAVGPMEATVKELNTKIEQLQKAGVTPETPPVVEVPVVVTPLTTEPVQKSAEEDPTVAFKAALKEVMDPINTTVTALKNRLDTFENMRGLPNGSHSEVARKDETADLWPAVKFPRLGQ